MCVTDPAPFLKDMDVEFFQNYKNAPAPTSHSPTAFKYIEPHVGAQAPSTKPTIAPGVTEASEEPLSDSGRIESKIVVLEDFIDTDAVCVWSHVQLFCSNGSQLAPNEFLTTAKTEEEFGAHVLEFTHPEFRDKVRGGQKVVVAGIAFGCGSSREVAVSALKGNVSLHFADIGSR